LPIPIWIPRLALPIGFGLLTVRFSQVLYWIIIGKKTHLIGDEVKEALKPRIDDDPPSQQGRP
jgi:C4-dicarboxylate transporter DctQ subunit